MQKKLISLGALLAGIAVILGAFGAHGLGRWLTEHFSEEVGKRTEWWETGSTYLMYHAIAIALIGITSQLVQNTRSKRWLNIAAILTLLGIVLFSGTLLLMTVTHFKLGMVAPFGGLALILGWFSFAVGAWGIRQES